MTRDDIIRMAWEAGFQVLLPQDHVDGTGGVYVVEDEIAGMLERFAALVAAGKGREIERLREALKKYGQHRSDCAVVLGGYQCTCGFNQQEQPR